MESQYTEMGRRIKLRRKELKIKQSEMAEALNVSNNHISSIETGKQKPSLDIFISELTKNFVELLVNRNSASHTTFHTPTKK